MAFQIEYSYRVIKSTWGIAIDIKGSLDIVSITNVPLEQFHHIQGCIFAKCLRCLMTGNAIILNQA